MTAQLDLFEAPAQVDDVDQVLVNWSAPHGRCGQCRWMDWSLPGCYDGSSPNGSLDKLGRCTNPDGRSYWLNPENTRVCPVAGPPPDGSWQFVSSYSAACDKVARR